ncbi:MAG TPA: DUF2306 domain-containing protein, partial [Vicinamibacterales bacterium]
MVILPVHILAGMLALLFGYFALFAKKGATVHRKAGMGFVIAMVVMSLSGALIATVKPDRGSIIAGLLTFYFVITGLMTVKEVPGHKRVQIVMMAAGFVLGLFAIWAGSWLARRGRPEAYPMFLFSAMAIGGAIGDFRMMRAGGIEGRPRIKRHLWRLCFAMWVAAASFFWGPPNRVPEIIRIPALLPIPVLTPIAVMLFWMWRMRGRKAVKGVVSSSAIVSTD